LILMTGLFMVAIVIAWTGPSIIPQPIAQPAKMNNDSPD
jgi:hypothetical protein